MLLALWCASKALVLFACLFLIIDFNNGRPSWLVPARGILVCILYLPVSKYVFIEQRVFIDLLVIWGIWFFVLFWMHKYYQIWSITARCEFVFSTARKPGLVVWKYSAAYVGLLWAHLVSQGLGLERHSFGSIRN